MAKRSRKTCEACGRAFQPDEDGLPGELYPICDGTCATCQRCGRRTRHDGDNAVSVASTDEDAERYDPQDLGACEQCWTEVKRTGKWPKAKR